MLTTQFLAQEPLLQYMIIRQEICEHMDVNVIYYLQYIPRIYLSCYFHKHMMKYKVYTWSITEHHALHISCLASPMESYRTLQMMSESS